MEKTFADKSITLTRRFQELHNQKHLPAEVVSLTGMNESILHMSSEKDKSRQLPHNYYVKVAVVIDKGLWNFYYSTVQSQSAITRRRNAIKCIHQVYSHLMNGINMLYKGITDTSIRISVVLSTFIILQTDLVFQHIESKVIHHNGIMYIDGLPYLKDVINWDTNTAANDELTFSHGIVFTKFKLYNKVFENNAGGGLCVTGGVCNRGIRMSIVEMRSYVWTVRAAAHEMGHSLGADHDGDEGSRECRADDEFIMGPKIVANFPGKPYNKNPWIFSTCSINAFKRTLPTKTCLSDAGFYFDHDDYQAYVKNEPGVVYSADVQCELIGGSKSVLCQTARKDICLLMRCTDPKTGICLPTYHGAARGTECGEHK
ncbi:hypothetical protein ACJMK2_022254, partial [Sinanodonta woodiana]